MGEFCNWTKAEYDAETSRERSTRLKSIVSPQGPRAYYFNAINPPPEPPKSKNELLQEKVDDKVKGNLLHSLVLENRTDWVTCDARVGTNDWKDKVEEHAGKWVIKTDDEREILAWRDGLMRNADVRKSIERESLAEHAILFDFEAWTDSGVETVPAKASIDKLHLDGSIDDLKTTRMTCRKDFHRQMEQLEYHFSAAFYERARNSIEGFDGFTAPFRHIVIVKSYPYHAYLWELERSTWLAMGHALVERAFHKLAECRQRHREILEAGGDLLEAWPDLEADPSPIAADPWVMDRYAQTY